MLLRIAAILIVTLLLGSGSASEGSKRRYCAVCDLPLTDTTKQREVGGREFLVHAHCSAHFDENPHAIAARTLPGGALFQEPVEPVGAPSRVWLYLSVYLLFGLAMGGLCAYFAIDRGLSGKRWYLWGFLGTVIALAAVLAKPKTPGEFTAGGLTKIPSTRDPEPCPRCGEGNHPASRRCSSCGGALEAHVPSEVDRLGAT